MMLPENAVKRGTEASGALFSECGGYRFALWRDAWEGLLFAAEEPPTGTCVFIGLNPSTANESTNDPTIRRCLGFTRSWNCRRFVMLNAYAFRSPHPRVMQRAADPVGAGNDLALFWWTRHAKIIVAAWGAHCSADRSDQVVRAVGRPLQCLGKNANGSPVHPLYIASDTPLISFADSTEILPRAPD